MYGMDGWCKEIPGGDLISRAAAIDALGERPMVWTESDYELGARNQYDADVLALKTVPSAQLEIVRCKNCKHNQLPSTCGNANCEIFYGMTDQDGFCHMAERRTDDQT